MKINELIKGFKVKRVEKIDEIKATMYELEHIKTTARLIYLDREDENKTFSIGFKTIPTDDTGVFHILEHSVLNGSDAYPVKEPFVDLLKGSLNTFLNAMTFPDKTVYPISSRNDKDFINLMRVYLDAVFHPLVVSSCPNVFRQEGWHYEINNKEYDPIFKGVVLNEMKGAYASADEIVNNEVMKALFPDSPYKYSSGGDPECIPNLSYEQFCDAHKKFYSPANSYIFLDGKMDIENVLGIIDDEYLSHYDASGENITIVTQKPVHPKDISIEYEIGENEDSTNKDRICYGYVCGKYDETEVIVGLQLLSTVLCSTNESIIKKAIIDAGLGEDVSFDVQDGTYQTLVTINIINTDASKEAEITKVLTDTINKVISEGLNKQEIEACLNKAEFIAKERDFGGAPTGIVYDILALQTWLYGGDPIDGILIEKVYKSLREKINTDFYKNLLKDYIINNPHQVKVIAKASNTIGKKKIEKEKERCHQAKLNWSNEELDEMIQFNKDFANWQSLIDTPEQKATLPKLHISDITSYPKKLEVEVKDNILIHKDDANGIRYVRMYFDATDFNEHDIQLFSILEKLLGCTASKNYQTNALATQMRSILGDFSISLGETHKYVDNIETIQAIVSFACLDINTDKAIELVKEIILNSLLDDETAILNIIKQTKQGIQMMFSSRGNQFASKRVKAMFSIDGVVSEYFEGYKFYEYIKKIDETFDSCKALLLKELKELVSKIFVKERVTISITGNYDDTIPTKLMNMLPHGQPSKKITLKTLPISQEAIVIPSQVGYAVTGYDVKDFIKNYGSSIVLTNILTYDYLWTNVRVKGGAYGCGFQTKRTGEAIFYSYRDPNPSSSLDIFANTSNYIKDFIKETDDIENYIIGAYGSFDPLLTVRTASAIADKYYFAQTKYEDICQIHNEILHTTKDDIMALTSACDKIKEKQALCVVGGKNVIDACGKKIKDVYEL